jgi:hypothetical protein
MSRLGAKLCKEGWILRSGAAPGADTAFMSEVPEHRREIYIPWLGFNGYYDRFAFIGPTDEAIAIAQELHPAWSKLSSQAKLLHGRNVHQVLGCAIEPIFGGPATPVSRFVVCWTPDGATTEEDCSRATGGSAMAIRVACQRKVPVFNLGRLKDLHRVLSYLG